MQPQGADGVGSAAASERPCEQTCSTPERLRLPEALGEAAFRASGLGGPDNMLILQQTLSNAHQQVIELAPPTQETHR
jgi:hypothetical protein